MDQGPVRTKIGHVPEFLEGGKGIRNPMPATLDTKGMNCPLPVLKAKKALRAVAAGDTLTVLTTDPSAERDFVAYCRSSGNELVESHDDNGVTTVVIKKIG